MCGIAGYFAPNGLLAGAAQAMGSALRHRGPDSDGVWESAEDRVALAHRRLAIVDLSEAGHQPMASGDGRLLLSYNGEIYNHLTLREQLRDAGQDIAWRGHSDTETLLRAIEIWGLKKTLQQADGMFAFALWDRDTKCLSLARDRLGEKPLYYGWQDQIFLFGSELKALQAHPAFAAEIDKNALTAYFRYRYVPAPYSIYKDIHKLEPGSVVTLSAIDKGLVHQRFWCPPAMQTHLGLDDAAYGHYAHADFTSSSDAVVIDELDRCLQLSVEQQCIADVPLGAFLSGGIDSSTVVALMQGASSTPVNTFSIGFEAAGYDEAVHARAVARHLGTHHEELYVSADDALAVIPSLPSMYDEPFADASQIPTHLVSQLARQHVTVSLSGDGGDELFGGYNRYRYAAQTWDRLTRIPQPLRRVAGSGLHLLRPEYLDSPALSRMLARVGIGPLPHLGSKVQKAAASLPSKSLDELFLRLQSDWHTPASLVPGGLESTAWVARYPYADSELSPLRWMMLQDMLGYLPGDILTKVDRAAMSVSLETRVPFLGRDVVEFAARLPAHFLIRDGVTKWCVRQVLERHVPASLFDRPKAGFTLPLNQWLRGPLKDWAADLLDPDALAQDELLDPSLISSTWQAHQQGGVDREDMLWPVLMFQAWRREHV